MRHWTANRKTLHLDNWSMERLIFFEIYLAVKELPQVVGSFFRSGEVRARRADSLAGAWLADFSQRVHFLFSISRDRVFITFTINFDDINNYHV